MALPLSDPGPGTVLDEVVVYRDVERRDDILEEVREAGRSSEAIWKSRRNWWLLAKSRSLVSLQAVHQPDAIES